MFILLHKNINNGNHSLKYNLKYEIKIIALTNKRNIISQRYFISSRIIPNI
jgi:hypothetical protein